MKYEEIAELFSGLYGEGLTALGQKEEDEWPVVTEKDEAPAGSPRECFWCKEKTGQGHAPNQSKKDGCLCSRFKCEIVGIEERPRPRLEEAEK